MPNAGDIVHAGDAIPSTWTSYTPTWTAVSANPSLGNGTITGQYLTAGTLVWVKIKLTMGSSTTYGTGLWRFTLPQQPLVDEVIPGFANDNSTGFRYPLMTRIILSSTSGDNMRIAAAGGNSGASSTTPFTWATSDVLILSGSYSAA